MTSVRKMRIISSSDDRRIAMSQDTFKKAAADAALQYVQAGTIVGDMALNVDGADEATKNLHLIKGGGGALTREKIVAAGAKKFVCIADESKLVDVLGALPLPIEVIPMARSYVARELVKLGGQPVLRQGFTTDNGNLILDVRNLQIMEPAKLEAELNNIPGVVTNGIFALRPADVLILGTAQGVRTLT